jgi:hypothetical protein
MAHGRRASWTGRPRPRIRHRPPQGFARLLQPGARLTGSSNFSPLSTTPASSWRLILERSSRRISDVSNRFWVKNRTYRKQTIKPRLTGARIALSDARSSIAKAISNRELFELEIPQPIENKRRRTALIETFEPNYCFNFRASEQVEKS